MFIIAQYYFTKSFFSTFNLIMHSQVVFDLDFKLLNSDPFKFDTGLTGDTVSVTFFSNSFAI